MKRSSVQASRAWGLLYQLDYWLLVPVLGICAIGLFVLRQVLALRFPGGYPRNIVVQTAAVFIGLAVLLIIVRVGIDGLRQVGWVMYGLAVFLQCLLPFFGDKAIAANTGSNSWLRVPVIGSLQPSEFSKAALCILTAYLLQRIREREYTYARGFTMIGVLAAPHIFLILVYQKDFGTAMVILLMLAVMIFVWGIRMRYVALTFSAAVISMPLLWLFYLKDYQKRRILSFLYPGFDAHASYNVEQAKKSIMMGGLTGNKTGEWVTVPVQESDFVFTAVAERMGFVGAAALLLLIFAYLMRALYIATKAVTPAERYMCTGIAAMFAFHSIENIGMTMGLLPVTGIPLPFVSQGGSAMVSNFVVLGVLGAASAHYRRRALSSL